MNSAAIVYARTDSTRFPDKCFHCLGGYSLIELVIKRVQKADIGQVILATTDRSVDDRLSDEGRRLGVRLVRGDTHNLVNRTLSVIDEVGVDAFCRVNADSPFVDIELLRLGRSLILRDIDFVTNLVRRTYPYGIALEWIIAHKYKELATNAHADEVEHVTKHLYRQDADINMVSIVQDGIDQSNCRLTVDYPADLSLLNELVKKISKDPVDLTYTDVLRFLNES